MSQPTSGGRYYRVNGELVAEADAKAKPAKEPIATTPSPATAPAKVSPAKVGGSPTAEEPK